MLTSNELIRFSRSPLVSEYYWGKIGVVKGWIRDLNLYQVTIEDLDMVVSPFLFTVIGD